MVYIYLLISGMLYSISASLPFTVSTRTQLFIGGLIGLTTAIMWALITRAVNKHDIPFWGLIYDTMLTLVFFLVPMFYIDRAINIYNYMGFILVLLGLVLVKL
ncbi:MAG: hypothetical protein RLZZ181_116 [Pseudomonadota bacterium]|jgi:uncharacterized membrane protein